MRSSLSGQNAVINEMLFEVNPLEYDAIIKAAHPSKVIFSNACFPIPSSWTEYQNARFERSSIADLDVPFNCICLLDSESPQSLDPSDSNNFQYFLLGGILGNSICIFFIYLLADEFDFDRTAILRKMGFQTRNLGSFQMTTDTAFAVVKKIIEDQIPLEQMEFIDRPNIQITPQESLVLNFRFLKDEHGQPLLNPDVKKILTNQLDEPFLPDMLE